MPMHMQQHGRHEPGPGPPLRDVQGGYMKTGGKRNVTYDIKLDDGRSQPVSTTFIVSDSMKVVFSAGMLEESGRTINLGGA
eukprot:3997467-Heterocapsa_arctica.AAC.1